MIASLFPAGVVTVVANGAAWQAALRPEEEACLTGASARRRREFAAGRACAREALARLGFPEAALGRRPDRSPRWPPGVVGSIAHCPGHCAAAVAPAARFAGLGLDLERAGRVAPAVIARVCRPEEHERLAALGDDWGTLAWVAKESAFKCWAPLAGTGLRLRDLDLDLDPAAGTFAARPPGAGAPVLAGRLASAHGLVAAGVALPAAG